MLKSILFLIAFALLPWWLSLLAERIDLPLSPSTVLSSWLRDNSGEILRERPPPGWREAVYFARNPDVMAAVRRGEFLSGYEHYVRHGRTDGRLDGMPAPDSPPPKISPAPPPPQETAAQPMAQPSPVPAPPLLNAIPPAPKPETAATASMMDDVPAVRPSRKPVPATPPPIRPTVGQVLSLRSAAHTGFTRIVLDSPAALRAERTPQHSPRTVGIELSAAWQPPRQGRLTDKSLSYRVETVGGSVRLLIESGGAIRIKALTTLPPEQPGGRYRLVLDIAPLN